MKVLAYDPHIADEVFERHQVWKVSLEELLTQADAVSVHVPKNAETTGMIGASELVQMRPGVVIINAARGGVVNEAALLKALQSGQVVAAGIDTWEEEPPQDNPFRDLPQVVMTPHIGASTVEAQIRIAETIAVQVPKALRGEVVDFPVNMPAVQVLDSPVVKSYTTLAERLGLFASQHIGFALDRLKIHYRGGLAKYDPSLLR
ncbi:MAG TPA: phosphoglycerate dehydrogenase, partial [Deltaproteobacteria bacterium]|nr:phosphoglycerate dehydrogenase [Deltaproteobacteria bacterium]